MRFVANAKAKVTAKGKPKNKLGSNGRTPKFDVQLTFRHRDDNKSETNDKIVHKTDCFLTCCPARVQRIRATKENE